MKRHIQDLRQAAAGVERGELKGVFCALGEVEGNRRGKRPGKLEEVLYEIFEGRCMDLWELPADVRATGLCLAASILEFSGSKE